MITEFPIFTKIDLNQKSIIDKFNSDYPPYSDFNFSSIFCWDIYNNSEICKLDKNLIICIPDYITGEKRFSLLGRESIDSVIKKLFTLTNEISLVPEDTIAAIKNPNNFIIDYDKDNYDYIFNINEHSDLTGSHFKSKRKRFNKIIKDHNDNLDLHKIDFKSPSDKQDIICIVSSWINNKNIPQTEANNELEAIKRAIANADILNLTGLILRVSNVPMGFSIVEKISTKFAIYHFQKTLLDISNLDIYLTINQAQSLAKEGVKYINWEQDLGIPGLRILKKSYYPSDLLRKFSIKPIIS